MLLHFFDLPRRGRPLVDPSERFQECLFSEKPVGGLVCEMGEKGVGMGDTDRRRDLSRGAGDGGWMNGRVAFPLHIA